QVKELLLSGSLIYPSLLLGAILNSSGFGLAPVILVGNKYNRVIEREVFIKEGSILAYKLEYNFIKAFAKNYINIKKAFYNIIRQLRR
ncbi:uncharacterized protein BDZ99DRAFT_401366, partial [Mytilinidion resinicola]